jgi:hypothetical protein
MTNTKLDVETLKTVRDWMQIIQYSYYTRPIDPKPDDVLPYAFPGAEDFADMWDRLIDYLNKHIGD